jgi:hypothetical protein
MSVYNYNTLTRANDGNTFEFNTNCNVLYVDELPSGVTLSLAIDNQNNPAITLRPKTQLRFKQNDRLFFTPSAATAGTIRIFLFLDESNLLEFDQSQYSSESTISGTVTIDGTVDVTKIGGSTTPVTNWTEQLKSSSTTGTRQIKYGILNTASATLYTVPASTVAYVHAVSINSFGLSNTDASTYLYLKNSSSAIVGTFLTQVINIDNDSVSMAVSYPTPVKMTAGEIIDLTGAAGSWSSASIYLTEQSA